MSYLVIVIDISNGDLVCQIFDKRDAFDFDIVNFPDLPGNIPKAPVTVHVIADKIQSGLP